MALLLFLIVPSRLRGPGHFVGAAARARAFFERVPFLIDLMLQPVAYSLALRLGQSLPPMPLLAQGTVAPHMHHPVELVGTGKIPSLALKCWCGCC